MPMMGVKMMLTQKLPQKENLAFRPTKASSQQNATYRIKKTSGIIIIDTSDADGYFAVFALASVMTALPSSNIRR
jgi:hypothetical protein